MTDAQVERTPFNTPSRWDQTFKLSLTRGLNATKLNFSAQDTLNV